MAKILTVAARIMDRVEFVDACWIWQGATNDQGYPQMRFQGKTEYVHRVSFFLDNGYWPVELDHTCRMPLCVNPEHLEDVTHAENITRAWACRVRSDKCPKGHRFTDKNTYRTPKGHRVCRKCRVLAVSAHRAKTGRRW